MKRTAGIFFLAISILLTACSNGGTDGYFVFLDDRFYLSEEDIYDKGTVIGQVLSSDISGDNKGRIKVKIENSHQYLMTDQATFYIDAGRLYYDSFKKFGTPLENGSRLLGFTSEGALRWFKTRTLFSDPATVAARQAEVLSGRFP